MKIGIVGGREYPDLDVVRRFIDTLDPDEDWIISGGARGVDQVADRYGRELGFAVLNFYPNRNKYGNGAYHVRNRKIAVESELLVAFWDGESTGTRSTIDYARELGKPVKIISPQNGKNKT